MKTRHLLPVLAGCAAALIALAVVLFRGPDSQVGQKPGASEEKYTGSKELTQQDVAADETSIDEQRSPADSDVESGSANEVLFRFSADKWIEVMRNQTPRSLWNTKKTLQFFNEEKAVLESMTFEEREAHVKLLGYSVWEWSSYMSDKENRVRKAVFEAHGSYHPIGKTPRSVIEVLAHGMDDFAAARYLYDPPSWWGKPEREYAMEYLNKALEKDPTSRDALMHKVSWVRDWEAGPIALQLIEHHPNDPEALNRASLYLRSDYPEETVYALAPLLDSKTGEWGRLSEEEKWGMRGDLGIAYERLGMLNEAYEQYRIASETGRYFPDGRFGRVKRGEMLPSIWEERAAAELAEAASEPPMEAPSPEGTAPPPPDPHDAPPPPTPPEPPVPPMDAEKELADAYAQFAEAYRSAFEAEYGPPADTPEGRMNALLGMARAFAKAGDAEQAQAAYNEARKRYTREQVQEAFRRLDEAERLRRQQRQEQEEARQDEDGGEENEGR